MKATTILCLLLLNVTLMSVTVAVFDNPADIAEFVAAHNAERNSIPRSITDDPMVMPMQWSEELAREAQVILFKIIECLP